MPLPIRASRRRAGPPRHVREVDELRRLHAAAVHAQERAHAHLLARGPVEHAERAAPPPARSSCAVSASADAVTAVGRLVDQVAGEAGRLRRRARRGGAPPAPAARSRAVGTRRVTARDRAGRRSASPCSGRSGRGRAARPLPVAWARWAQPQRRRPGAEHRDHEAGRAEVACPPRGGGGRPPQHLGRALRRAGRARRPAPAWPGAVRRYGDPRPRRPDPRTAGRGGPARGARPARDRRDAPRGRAGPPRRSAPGPGRPRAPRPGLRADVELHPSRSFRRRSASSAKARRTMDSTPSVTSSPPSASGSHHWTASASEPASARPAVGVAR